MSGKGHIAAGTILIADAVLIHDFAMKQAGASAVVLNKLSQGWFWLEDHFNVIDGGTTGIHKWLLVTACILLYYLGNLLPDIDSKYSTITRMAHFHLPVKHRGITHTVYCWIGLYLLGWKVHPLFYMLMLGVAAHVVIDMGSKAGWVPFYPLGRYRVWDGCILSSRASRRRFYYKSGDVSERLYLFIMFGLTIVFGFIHYVVNYL